MNWLRWYTGSATDPKFAAVARRAGQNVAAVLAVWAMLLERACEADTRGDVDGFDCEGADVVLGLDDGAACAIVEAMKGKGLIEQGRLANWDKRQPKREDDSTARVREHRARKRAEEAESVTQCNALSRDVTQCNASQRTVTHGNARGDKRREDKNINTLSPLGHTGNEEPARAREASQGSSTGKNPPPPPADEPGIEFVELRQFYSEHFRDEGTLAGFAEFKQARAGSQWPGFSRLYEHLNACLQCGQWEKGYAPGLARYFRERMWKDQAKPRASPQRTSPAKPGEFDPDRQAQIFRDVLADLEAEDARAGQATQAGGPVRLGPELRQGIPAASGATLDAPARAVQR